MKKIIIAALVLTSGITLTSSAQAQQVYLAGTVGESFWNANCSGTTSCSTHDNDYKAILGYNFNSHWGIEASYFSLGQLTANLNEINGTIKATGVDLGGVFRTGFTENWGLFAKLGVSDNRANITANEITVGSNSVMTKKAELFAAFGVTYSITPDFAFRADVDTRKVEVDANHLKSSGNVTSLNVGAQVTF